MGGGAVKTMTHRELLAAYHAIAVAVDEVACRQEAHTKYLGELARLARTDWDAAQRLRSEMASVRVWDFGDAVSELRALRKKSAKILGVP